MLLPFDDGVHNRAPRGREENLLGFISNPIPKTRDHHLVFDVPVVLKTVGVTKREPDYLDYRYRYRRGSDDKKRQAECLRNNCG